MAARPVCACHGEPMYWHKRKDLRSGGLWRCREKRKALDRKQWANYYFERMPTQTFIRRRLDIRRRQALARRRERQLREV